MRGGVHCICRLVIAIAYTVLYIRAIVQYMVFLSFPLPYLSTSSSTIYRSSQPPPPLSLSLETQLALNPQRGFPETNSPPTPPALYNYKATGITSC